MRDRRRDPPFEVLKGSICLSLIKHQTGLSSSTIIRILRTSQFKPRYASHVNHLYYIPACLTCSTVMSRATASRVIPIPRPPERSFVASPAESAKAISHGGGPGLDDCRCRDHISDDCNDKSRKSCLICRGDHDMMSRECRHENSKAFLVSRGSTPRVPKVVVFKYGRPQGYVQG